MHIPKILRSFASGFDLQPLLSSAPMPPVATASYADYPNDSIHNSTIYMHDMNTPSIRKSLRGLLTLFFFALLLGCIIGAGYRLADLFNCAQPDSLRCYQFRLCFWQCAIPVLSIIFAGILIALMGKKIRSKVLLISLFILLVIFGIIVNHQFMGKDNHSLIELILLPFNTTLASFFPSRGSYSYYISIYNKEWLTPYLIFHALTYFYIALLGFSLFGQQLLNRIRIPFIYIKHRNFFWGYSEGAFELAKDMIHSTIFDKPMMVLDDEIEFSSEQEKQLFNQLSNEGILAIERNFKNFTNSARSLQGITGLGTYLKYKWCSGAFFLGMRHYFITEDQDFNVKYALLLLQQLEQQQALLRVIVRIVGVMHVFVRTELEGIDAFFNKEALKELVEVHIFNQSDITARQFVAQHPVLDLAKRTKPLSDEKWIQINHDKLEVTGDINILLLGMGWTGLEMLKKEVCDAQFIGKHRVNVVVIDNDYKQFHGRYHRLAKEAAKHGVTICINPLVWIDKEHHICKQWLQAEHCAKIEHMEEKHIHQANSQLFYEWLEFTDETLQMPNILFFNRIIVALGSDELNVNTALQLTYFRNHYLTGEHALHPELMPEPIFAHVRDKDRYAFYENSAKAPIAIFGGLKTIYTVSNLMNEKMDTVAKWVNYAYSDSELQRKELEAKVNKETLKDVEKAWAKCSIFDQDSSRAVALNVQNIVSLCGGIERLKAIVDAAENTEMMNRLCELEHKRWNAFHYMRGIEPWPFDQVIRLQYKKQELEARGKLFFHGTLVRHICLVDFDQIDKATEKVRDLGRDENFKDSDRRITIHFPTFYKILTDNNATKSTRL